MKVFPILGADAEKSQSPIGFLWALGVPVYKDPRGAFYAVVDGHEPLFRRWQHLIFETGAVPAAWVLVKNFKAAAS
jgi:hypothetical protein